MKKATSMVLGTMVMGLLGGVGMWRGGGFVGAQGARAQDVPLDRVSIGGVVVNKSQTPEAGVWVIAETTSLSTHFRRIVVTDEQGRFVVPDLPEASYDVWVRGYGLRDSVPVKATRGQRLTLAVAAARTPQEAAKVYPANYWLSLYQQPAKEEIPKEFESQDHWLAQYKMTCILCHQQGAELTRIWTKPEDWDVLWKRAGFMTRSADALGREALMKSLSAWAAQIEAGEVPPAPPRPAGVERNVVVTQWEWGTKESYIHDEVATDKRNPHLYPYGNVWGVDYGQDKLWALNPKTHQVTAYPSPTRNGYNSGSGIDSWKVYNNPAHPHNPMLDATGKVWITQAIRPPKQLPRWTKDVISTTSDDARIAAEKLLADDYQTGAELAYFDTKTGQFATIDTAYSTHHLQFDWEGRLWTSSLNGALGLGMFDPAKFDPKNPYETEGKAQKAFVSIDPKTGKSVAGGGYGIVVSPVDGTVWRAYIGSAGAGNKINKFDPKTQTFKDYPLPAPGRGPRGIDATTDGKIWFATGSGHLGRFDPKTERFTYWESPGPKIKGTGKETGSADFHYYIWVDQFNTLGLGTDMVMVTGTNSDAVLVFDSATERWTVLRVPYPLGMFHRGLDGRIDDASAGWKGRGLWVNYGGDPILFTEKTQIGYINQIQLRPDPLAR